MGMVEVLTRGFMNNSGYRVPHMPRQALLLL